MHFISCGTGMLTVPRWDLQIISVNRASDSRKEPWDNVIGP
jgi:hypothetical protein